jgi:hypothetical protein
MDTLLFFLCLFRRDKSLLSLAVAVHVLLNLFFQILHRTRERSAPFLQSFFLISKIRVFWTCEEDFDKFLRDCEKGLNTVYSTYKELLDHNFNRFYHIRIYKHNTRIMLYWRSHETKNRLHLKHRLSLCRVLVLVFVPSCRYGTVLFHCSSLFQTLY